MIIVKIGGGLGNQLFQYAFGLSLAAFYKTELRLDAGDYKAAVGDPKLGVRVFGLDNFQISAPRASASELAEFRFYFHKLFGKLRRFYSRPNTYYKRKYLIEPARNYFCFDDRVFKIPGRKNIYCEGFFQSVKYFSAVTDLVKKEFTFKAEPEAVNARMLSEIIRTNSVALHIRHGDNVLAASNLGVLPLAYYQAAIKRLAATEPNLVFYVFSDDPEWARENLRLDYPTVYVSHNGDTKNYEDLRLMINCRHHIIGNSTFSWWGAWLGQKDGQKVFAPRHYHVGEDVSRKDFYPSGWIAL